MTILTKYTLYTIFLLVMYHMVCAMFRIKTLAPLYLGADIITFILFSSTVGKSLVLFALLEISQNFCI